jgi:hypothetical protein
VSTTSENSWPTGQQYTHHCNVVSGKAGGLANCACKGEVVRTQVQSYRIMSGEEG